jgi:hypothetical protein
MKRKPNIYFDRKSLGLKWGKRPKRRARTMPHRGTVRLKMPDVRNDVASALVNLGYPKFAARSAAQMASGSDFESMFRSALGSVKAKNPRVFPGNLSSSEITALRKLVRQKTKANRRPRRGSEENIVSVKKRNPKKKKRSKSRKGVMPAGLRKYWAKKRAAKAKRSNPKKKRRTRRKNIRGLHPVARLREYKRQRKGGSSRKKSLRVALSSRNPPRKRRVKIIKTNLRKGTKAFRQFVAATRAKYGSARVL